MSKYRELVDLLEETGVMQLDQEWAKEIQSLVEKHKGNKAEKQKSHWACTGCNICGSAGHGNSWS